MTRQRTAPVNDPAPERPRWATPDEAADYCGVTRRTIDRWRLDGTITSYKAGPRLVRLDLNEVDAAIRGTGNAGRPGAA